MPSDFVRWADRVEGKKKDYDLITIEEMVEQSPPVGFVEWVSELAFVEDATEVVIETMSQFYTIMYRYRNSPRNRDCPAETPLQFPIYFQIERDCRGGGLFWKTEPERPVQNSFENWNRRFNGGRPLRES